MKIERDIYIGAITAITYSPDGKYIVYGSFACLVLYMQEAVLLFIYMTVQHSKGLKQSEF